MQGYNVVELSIIIEFSHNSFVFSRGRSVGNLLGDFYFSSLPADYHNTRSISVRCDNRETTLLNE